MAQALESRLLGPLVSRVLPVAHRSWVEVVFQAGKPVLDSELNLQQEIREYTTASDKQLENFSGVYLGDDSVNAAFAFYTTRGVHFDSAGKPFEILRPNEWALDPFKAYLAGYLVDVNSSTINGGVLDGRFISVQMPPPPLAGTRIDMVFLEVFWVLIDPLADTEVKPAIDKIFLDGNRQEKDPTDNPTHDMIDPMGQMETTKRVQLQYRIRVVAGVDLEAYPDGLGDPTIVGWGALNDNATTYPFYHMWPVDCDYGLYRAGDGGADCRNILGTVDGYTYAIPLFAVHRRNRTAYDVHCNPNGSLGSLAGAVKSDRPDCLLSDEITERDVLPLYHFIAPQGLNFEEMAENAFDRLVRGWLKTNWRRDWSSTAHGTTLLEVDGIYRDQQQGVRQIARPDGIRDQFSDSACTTIVKDTFNSGEDKNDTILSYIAACRRVTLKAPEEPTGTTICPDAPVMKWKNPDPDKSDDVVIDDWVGLGTNIAFAVLDNQAPNYQESGDVVITYKVCYGKGNGLKYAPIALYRFLNERSPLVKEDFGFGFVGGDCPRPICPCDELDDTMDHWQDITPCKIDDLPHREYRGSFHGNGTDTVVIAVCTPCEPYLGDFVRICGCDEASFPYNLLGFAEFRLVSHRDQPIFPVLSIIRAGENTYEVKFCRPILATETVSYRAITKAKEGGVDPQCRGLVYTMEPTLLQQDVAVPTPDGYYVYSFVSDKPLAKNLFTMPFDREALVKPFMYAYGLAIPIYDYIFVDDFTVRVRVEAGRHPTCTPPSSLSACTCISNKAELYVLEKVAPGVGDNWQLYYDLRPYQGLGTGGECYNAALDLHRHQFIIKSDHQMVVNTRGSGACQCGCIEVPCDGCTLYPVVSEMLPLPCNHRDSDLEYHSPDFESMSPYPPCERTFFGLYHNMQQVKREDVSCCTKDYRAGNMLGMVPCDFVPPASECPCICDVPLPPNIPKSVRGIPDYSLLYLRDRFRFVADTFFGWRFPALRGPAYYQGIWYATVADRFTGEVYLMVLTAYFDSQVGNDVLHSKCVVDKYPMAFDFYRIEGRPLARVCPVYVVTETPPITGHTTGWGSGNWWGSSWGTGNCAGNGFLVIP